MIDSPKSRRRRGPFQDAFRRPFGHRFRAPFLAKFRLKPLLKSVGWVALLLCLILAADPASAQSEKQPLPRFASLDSSEVNLRAGPGETYPKLWLYQRDGMPMEIIEEFDVWRRVRDYQGVVGWVKSTLLSSRRMAIITEQRRALHEDPLETSRIVAYADPGVIGKLLSCDGHWCRLDIKGYKGWLPRDQFFGAYPEENFKE
jgi:SH3-like domain-containing protein